MTTTIPMVVSVEDTDGAAEEDLRVYAFNETRYTGYNGTTDVTGLVTFTLPMGNYRFRADKADAPASACTQFRSSCQDRLWLSSLFPLPVAFHFI